MATARRVKRLEQMILETAATHVLRELSDPRIGVVSITRVKLAPDLTHALLFWSCLGDETQLRTCERGLTDALGSIQRAVAGALQTRTTPRLELRHDEGMVHAQRLEEIFTKLRDERGDDDSEGETPMDAEGETPMDAEGETPIDTEGEGSEGETPEDPDGETPDGETPAGQEGDVSEPKGETTES